MFHVAFQILFSPKTDADVAHFNISFLDHVKLSNVTLNICEENMECSVTLYQVKICKNKEEDTTKF